MGWTSDVGQGIDTLFAEITELAPNCKFRNCTHDHEPGCAVLAAIAAVTIVTAVPVLIAAIFLLVFRF